MDIRLDGCIEYYVGVCDSHRERTGKGDREQRSPFTKESYSLQVNPLVKLMDFLGRGLMDSV